MPNQWCAVSRSRIAIARRLQDHLHQHGKFASKVRTVRRRRNQNTSESVKINKKIINSRIKWLINLNLTIWFIPFKCEFTITEITTLIIIYQLSKKYLLFFKQIWNTFILVALCIWQKKKIAVSHLLHSFVWC